MKLRRGAAESEVEEAAEPLPPGKKGRPTPKRRDAEGRRGPVTAPKTRKEAYARQKQLSREQRSTKPAANAKPRSMAEQRAALKSGEVLAKRDQGPTRGIARDYVDSHRMLCNYMLLLFPIFIISSLVPALRFVEALCGVILLVMIGEAVLTGRRVKRLAEERGVEERRGAASVGFYAMSRAYLPRRWRIPAPQAGPGDKI